MSPDTPLFIWAACALFGWAVNRLAERNFMRGYVLGVEHAADIARESLRKEPELRATVFLDIRRFGEETRIAHSIKT